MIGTLFWISSSRDLVPTSVLTGMLHEIWTLDLTMLMEASWRRREHCDHPRSSHYWLGGLLYSVISDSSQSQSHATEMTAYRAYIGQHLLSPHHMAQADKLPHTVRDVTVREEMVNNSRDEGLSISQRYGHLVGETAPLSEIECPSLRTA